MSGLGCAVVSSNGGGGATKTSRWGRVSLGHKQAVYESHSHIFLLGVKVLGVPANVEYKIVCNCLDHSLFFFHLSPEVPIHLKLKMGPLHHRQVGYLPS